MPRPSPEKLQEAKRRRAEERRQEEEQQRLQREQEAARQARIMELRELHTQLESFVDGIYQELSKLGVKWPTQPVSELTLKQANRAIHQLKEMMSGEDDPFVEDITEFIPAGDMPEARDVVLVLRQVKQTLDRWDAKYRRSWQDILRSSMSGEDY